jgi:hypothetical protein
MKRRYSMKDDHNKMIQASIEIESKISKINYPYQILNIYVKTASGEEIKIDTIYITPYLRKTLKDYGLYDGLL